VTERVAMRMLTMTDCRQRRHQCRRCSQTRCSNVDFERQVTTPTVTMMMVMKRMRVAYCCRRCSIHDSHLGSFRPIQRSTQSLDVRIDVAPSIVAEYVKYEDPQRDFFHCCLSWRPLEKNSRKKKSFPRCVVVCVCANQRCWLSSKQTQRCRR
jgi:hypothetical protein